METPYRPQTFSQDQVLTREIMDQMVSNQRWIYENTPRARWYFINEEKIKETDFVITCGRVWVAPNKKDRHVYESVALGAAFDSSCRPNISIGICSEAEKEIFVAVSGPGNKVLPDSTGFELDIFVTKDRTKGWEITKGFYIFWQAAGWKLKEI